MSKIFNQNNTINSLQVSTVYNIPAGNFNPGLVFLINNITEDVLTVTIVPASQNTAVETKLQVGWNPIICKEVKNVTAQTLQYGY